MELELRIAVEAIPVGLLADTDPARIATTLALHEAETTALLRSWSTAHLAGGRQVRRELFEGTDVRTDQARSTAATIIKQLRSCHAAAANRIAAELGPRAGAAFSTLARERMYPEIYPDRSPARDQALRAAGSLMGDPTLDERRRGAIHGALAWYEVTYAASCATLESFCDAWDDRATSGDNKRLPTSLAPALEPLLAERDTLADELLRLCAPTSNR